jgi:hypothetical protein
MFFGPLLGVGLMLAAFGAFLFGRFSPAVFGVFLVFAGQVFLLRYLRGEKFPGYLVYLHPIVLLLLGSGLDHLSRWGKRAGGLALLVVILISISAAVLTADRTHNDARRLWEMEKTVAARLAGEGVAVYGKGLATSNGSFSLALLLQNEGLMNDNGRAVGVCLYSLEACDEKNIREIARTEFQGQIYVAADLSGVEKGRLIKDNNWYPFSTLAVFADVQHWWRK